MFLPLVPRAGARGPGAIVGARRDRGHRRKYEFRARNAGTGPTTGPGRGQARSMAGGGVRARPASPYRPLTEALLQALRGLPFPADDGLAPWRAALRAILPAIAVAEGDGHGDHSPAVRGEAVLQLLRRLAGSAGLLLVLEDLHWADPDTLAGLGDPSDNPSPGAVLCGAPRRGEPGPPGGGR